MEIKKQMYQFSDAYDMALEVNLDEIFALKGKFDIQELFEQVNQTVLNCTEHISVSGKALSYITQEALHYIKANYSKDISLSDIAKYVNVVPGYLSRIFNREMGVAIPAHMSGLRVEKAKSLLTETNLKIFEVSAAVGIEGPKHFGRIFKKAVGCTPQEYRLKI